MKSTFVFLLLLPLFVACGKASNPASPTPTPTPTPTGNTTNSGMKWTTQQYDLEVKNCKNNLTSSTSSQADSLCRCVYNSASKQWTYSEYNSDRGTYIDMLDSQGVLDNCIRNAGK